MPIITVREISKHYPARPGAKALFGRGGIASWFRAEEPSPPALAGVSLSVEPGESLGIIGGNGSGKSTLLKILAGVTLPTSGEVLVEGRVASLLELGAGFHPMLTGRENVYLNATILGLRRREVDTIFDDIVAFSGIGEFIDQPVDTYSSGMYVRIAFSVAVHANPDIFLVDEVLAVGDEAFQRKCRRKIAELKAAGKTIIFVSHDLGIVNALCDRVVLLNRGRMIERDAPQAAIDYYLRQIGHASGIHRMQGPCSEVIFSHGRISLFHAGKEITAPGGLGLTLQAFEQPHPSTEADWNLACAEPDRFIAEGTMSRMPLTVTWEGKLDDDVLTLTVSFTAQQHCQLDAATVQFFLPLTLTTFHLGAGAIDTPDIPPTALEPTALTLPDAGSRGFLAVAPDGNAPPVSLAFTPGDPRMTVQLINTDYMTGARCVTFATQRPQSDREIPAGRHELATFHLDLGMTADNARERWSALDEARTVRAGALTVKAGRGRLACFENGQSLTHAVHAQAMLCIGQLWVLSDALAWNTPERRGDTLTLEARSLRFPLRLRWTLGSEPHGVRWRVDLIADDHITLDGHNVTLALTEDFRRWNLGDEQGDFPPFHDEQAWRGLNTRYTPTRKITAARDEGLAVGLSIPEDAPPQHPSALNTGSAQAARVLQFLENPAPSHPLAYAPGEHCLFNGWITLEREDV